MLEGGTYRVILVISSPNDNRRMMTQTLDSGHCFVLDRLAELWDMGWVVSAAKSKVLPNKQSNFVTDFVKYVLFVDSAAPNPV